MTAVRGSVFFLLRVPAHAHRLLLAFHGTAVPAPHSCMHQLEVSSDSSSQANAGVFSNCGAAAMEAEISR
eukprot:CAMPEP_0114626530 /NCGR_PEP_ID=MMETSP0168-20121206/11829_1 /TAXON_ID=95228 ORGANISM="Vannella sp., Strain DIVA3 517/6/12" /NCGR_SAMPLE_ID=MMETSP0168 /ASSEMBLY_ACC=CAM_ASM_000044 /LENGTH=69 /DNA_ID=CAMNT_0001837837 /DNA_START=207 /DNA_END=416 /DNA_ORIENTATION=+